ncbi:MAG: hypothetical protein RRA15_03315 [bacterium]|nr:hypothetical protein [bacterium]MDT8365503.1 hypothetical protein [bacterium]
MKTGKFLTWISIGLFMGTVLTTTAMSGMDGGSSGGGMGGSGSENGDKGMDSADRETDSHQDRQPGAGMKSDPAAHEFKSLPRFSTGTMDDGGVKMELEPYSYENGVFRVKFFANTHTANLGDYDMMELMHIEFNDTEYKPVSADRMRGHHAGGEVTFNLPEAPDSFRIIVRDLPGMEKRIFEW